MKHLLYFILSVLIVYLIGSLLMADFSWILHTGFLGWIGAIFIILWFFLQIENEYGGWNIEEEEIDSWNEEDESVIQINPDKNKEKIDGTVNQIREILGTAEKGHLYDDLHNAKILIFRKEESVYAVDMGNSTIVNLRDTDVDLSRFVRHERGAVAMPHPTSPQNTNSQHINAGNLLRPTGSDHHSNREWEVGGGSNWDDIDDERRFKR